MASDKNCPALDKTCEKCGKIGHFRKACRSETEKVNKVEKEETLNPKLLYKKITIGKDTLNFVYDTGITCSLINKKFLTQDNYKKITKSYDVLKSYNKLIPHEGKIRLDIKIDNFLITHEFYVVERGDNIYGLDLKNKLKAEKKQLFKLKNEQDTIDQIVSKYKKKGLFSGVGCATDKEVEIKIDESRNWKEQKTREVPFALKEKVEAELARLENDGVISRLTKTKYDCPIVIIRKPDGQLRIYGDFRPINELINNVDYPMPRLDELLLNMEGELKNVARLDLKNAFCQPRIKK